MNQTLLLRLLIALLCVVAPLLLFALLPTGSAFAASGATTARFDLWHGVLVLADLALAGLMARLLTRL